VAHPVKIVVIRVGAVEGEMGETIDPVGSRRGNQITNMSEATLWG
jgi:hypothetical protein